MNPEDVVESFVATIILGVMVVVVAQLFYPDVGQVFVGLLPDFVEIMVYLMIFVIFASLVFQLIEEF
jgi:putative exporter of polyketide antibiotics